jgi:hypothetical protein
MERNLRNCSHILHNLTRYHLHSKSFYGYHTNINVIVKLLIQVVQLIAKPMVSKENMNKQNRKFMRNREKREYPELHTCHLLSTNFIQVKFLPCTIQKFTPKKLHTNFQHVMEAKYKAHAEMEGR